METAPYFEAERPHFVTNAARASNRARRPVEGREEPVASAIDFASAESCELAARVA